MLVPMSGGRPQILRTFFNSRAILLLAFAFAVMADPVSSVAYAIEAALRSLSGDLRLLLPTMALVIAIIGFIIINYHQMVARFPEGGGDAAAAGSAFGEAWAFVPIGSLIVDYVLTISISVAAGASAIVAYFPTVASTRIPIALTLLVLVAGLTWFGHGGRTIFALMTIGFVGVGSAMVLIGFVARHPTVALPVQPTAHNPLLAVVVAFPVAMALATGVEAPSSAMAQLGQLDNNGRRRFGRITLWLTLVIVAWMTFGITWLAVRLGVGLPPQHSTQIAEVARLSAGGPVFAAFQLTTTLLLLAAASSSFQAGPGLLKALARRARRSTASVGVLPSWLGRTNAHHTPYWGVVVCFAISASVVTVSCARDQQLVLFYAVAVFLSFFVGLISMARFNRAEGNWVRLSVNILGAGVVGFTLLINMARGYPLVSLGAALLIAIGLYLLWVRAGRPRGVSSALAQAEREVADSSLA